MADQDEASKQAAQVGAELRNQMNQMVRRLMSSQREMGKQLGLDDKALNGLEKQLKDFMKGLNQYTDSALGIGKAIKKVEKAINLYGIDLGDTAKELEKLAKDLKSDGTKGGQASKVREQARKIKDLRNSVEEHQKEFIDRVLLGGWSESDRRALIQAYKVKEGPSKDVSAEIRAIDELARDAQEAAASGAKDARKKATKLAREIKKVYAATEEALGDKAREIEKIGEDYARQINDLQMQGKKVPLSLKLKGWSKGNGGAGIAETANEKLQNNGLAQKTGAANFAGQFFKDGKLSKSNIAMYLGEQGLNRAKFGLETYKTTGRQFGMEGQGLGGMYSTYQGASKDLAGIGMRTGVFDQGEQLRALQASSQAVRAGGPDKYKVQLKATEDILDASNSLGVNSERLAAVLGGIRSNLGGSSKSITGYLGDMKDTLKTINGDVGGDMKVSSEEITGIYEDLAKDIENAGMNMKMFSRYTKESQTWARQLAVPLARALEMGKQLADLQSGKSASAYGTGVMAAATGGLSKMRIGATGKSQLSSKTTDLSQNGSQDDFIASLQQDILSSNLSNENKDELKKYVEQPDVAEWVSAAQSGDWAMYLTSPEANTKFMQISRRLKDLGAGSLLGIDFESANKAFADSILNIGGKGVRGRKIRSQMFGVNSEQQRILEKDLNAMSKGGLASGPEKPGQGRDAGMKDIKKESGDFAKASAAADPMAAFKNAVESFAGSVNSFGAMLAAQGAFELANKTGMLAKAGGWAKGLFAGGGGAATTATGAAGATGTGTTVGGLAVQGGAVGAAATVGAAALAAGSIAAAVNQSMKAADEGSNYSSTAAIDKAWEEGNYIDWWARNGTKDLEDMGSWVSDKTSKAWNWAFGNSDAAASKPGQQTTQVKPNGDIHVIIPGDANAQSLANQAKSKQHGKH